MATIRRIKTTEKNKEIVKRLEKVCFDEEEFYPFENRIWWVAYDGPKPIGYCGVKESEDYAFFCRAGVLPECQGKGIHKRFLKKRLNWAKKNPKIKQVITYTHPTNIISSNNLIHAGFKLYSPEYKWGGKEMLYWYKDTSL